MPLTPTQKRAFSWLALLLGLWAVLWLLAPVLTPFVVAAILAYALTPVVDKLDALGGARMPRVLAVVLVELVFLALLLSVALLIVPILLKQLPLLREQVPPLLNQFNEFLSPKLAALGLTVSLDVASIRTFLAEHLSANLENSVGQLLASARMGGSVALSLLGNAVLIPVVLFYLLMEWKRFMALLLVLVPPRLRPAVDSFTVEADSVLGQYLRGQLLVMVAVVYGLGQWVESFFLTPYLVGERIGLHPVAVIFALLAFGHLLGFVGVLIALPLSAVLLVAIRRIRTAYLDSTLYRDT